MKKSNILATALYLMLLASASAHASSPAITCWLTGETLTGNILQTVAGNGDTLEEATQNAFASCRYYFLKNCRIDRCVRN